MKLILNAHNRNFEIAFALVMRDYRDFPYDKLSTIELISSKAYIQSNNLATFHHRGPKITVRNGHYSIPDYISSLVHELTHLEQFVSGRMVHMQSFEYEKEAYAAGDVAKSCYEGRF